MLDDWAEVTVLLMRDEGEDWTALVTFVMVLVDASEICLGQCSVP